VVDFYAGSQSPDPAFRKPKPWFLKLAERGMDFRTGTWINPPYPGDQTMLSERQEYSMVLAEVAAQAIAVWSKPDKYRTTQDYLFMSWVNSKGE
jgi:hypothetical protein